MIEIEYKILSQLLRITTPYTKRYLEIGSYHGRSLRVACDANPEMQVHSIDKKHDKKLRRTAQRYPQITLHKSDSKTIDWGSLGHFDSIYIDGDHDYPGVKSDLKNSWSVWNKNGIFFGDDYNTAPGVFDAVNDFFDVAWDEERPGQEYMRSNGKTTPEASPEQVLDNAPMLKAPKTTSKGGHFQVFGMVFVYFTDLVFNEHYDEIHQMAHGLFSDDTESMYYANRYENRQPYTLPSQVERNKHAKRLAKMGIN